MTVVIKLKHRRFECHILLQFCTKIWLSTNLLNFCPNQLSRKDVNTLLFIVVQILVPMFNKTAIFLLFHIKPSNMLKRIVFLGL